MTDFPPGWINCTFTKIKYVYKKVYEYKMITEQMQETVLVQSILC